MSALNAVTNGLAESMERMGQDQPDVLNAKTGIGNKVV